MDWHLGPYLAASEGLEAVCDELDDTILAEQSIQSNLLPAIASGKHYISDLRRWLVPQRSVFYGLSRPHVALVTGIASNEQFKNLERRFERALDIVEHGREQVQSSFDLYSARLGEKTNVLIRRLTYISIVLGAVGAVAGLFGMNFDTPYTHSGVLGFWLVIGALGTFIAVFGFVSRWQRWI